MSDEKRTVHAVVIPWQVSSGLYTWCGRRFDDPDVKHDDVASMPEAVSCKDCIRSMKGAKDNLDDWVPRLRG